MRLKWHTAKSGRSHAFLIRHDGPGGCQRLGPMSRDAAERLRMEAEAAAGEPVRRVRMVASALLEGFLASRRAVGRTPETVDGYRYALAPFLVHQGAKPVRAWNQRDLEGWIAAHPAWSRRQVSKFATACGTLIAWGNRTGLDIPDFAGGFEKPRVRKVKRAALRLPQLLALLEAVRDEPMEVAIGLAGFGGVSRCDLPLILWEHVDLGGSMIRYARRKTREEATVPIVAPLREILLRHRATHGPVLRDLPASSSALTKRLREAFTTARVERPAGQAWHLLRRSCGSILGRLGVAPHIIGAILGHVRGSPMPLDYMIPDEEGARDAGARLDRAVAATASGCT